MWKDLVNIPFTAANCLQCHLGVLRSLCGYSITYNRTIKAPKFGNFSRLIPYNSKPKSGFVALGCRNNDGDDDDVLKKMLLVKTGSLKNPKTSMSFSWRKGAICSLNTSGVFLDSSMWNHSDPNKPNKLQMIILNNNLCFTVHIRTSWFFIFSVRGIPVSARFFSVYFQSVLLWQTFHQRCAMCQEISDEWQPGPGRPVDVFPGEWLGVER